MWSDLAAGPRSDGGGRRRSQHQSEACIVVRVWVALVSSEKGRDWLADCRGQEGHSGFYCQCHCACHSDLQQV